MQVSSFSSFGFLCFIHAIRFEGRPVSAASHNKLAWLEQSRQAQIVKLQPFTVLLFCTPMS